MKKQLTVLGIVTLLITGVTFTAAAQKKEDKRDKKEQKHRQDKGHDKHDKAEHGNSNKSNGHDHQASKVNEKEHKYKNDKKYNAAKNNRKNDNGKDNLVGKANNGKDDKKEGYYWTRETFKDRKKIKTQEKVTLCHKFNSKNEPAVTINISSNALKAHMKHGDVVGGCPEITSSKFSNVFLVKRNDYYNSIQSSYEQTVYSRSMLDYALIRLSDSRLQLVTLQSNNVPQAEIARKQAVVVELEQNVSLLETLVGVAANLVINKLQ